MLIFARLCLCGVVPYSPSATPFSFVLRVLRFGDFRNQVNRLRTLQYNLDAKLDHVRLQAMVSLKLTTCESLLLATFSVQYDCLRASGYKGNTTSHVKILRFFIAKTIRILCVRVPSLFACFVRV